MYVKCLDRNFKLYNRRHVPDYLNHEWATFDGARAIRKSPNHARTQPNCEQQKSYSLEQTIFNWAITTQIAVILTTY